MGRKSLKMTKHHGKKFQLLCIILFALYHRLRLIPILESLSSGPTQCQYSIDRELSQEFKSMRARMLLLVLSSNIARGLRGIALDLNSYWLDYIESSIHKEGSSGKFIIANSRTLSVLLFVHIICTSCCLHRIS